jgi:hypothetical protein
MYVATSIRNSDSGQPDGQPKTGHRSIYLACSCSWKSPAACAQLSQCWGSLVLRDSHIPDQDPYVVIGHVLEFTSTSLHIHTHILQCSVRQSSASLNSSRELQLVPTYPSHLSTTSSQIQLLLLVAQMT